MARPIDLVTATSEVTGIAPRTVAEIDRKVRNAGLRQTGARGSNAPRMTPRDAAVLLTAILTNPQANQAAEAVQRYQLTRPDKSRSTAGFFASSGIRELGALSPQNSFVDAIEALVAACMSDGSLGAVAKKGGTTPAKVEIHAHTRATSGRIRVSGLPSGQVAYAEYRPANLGARRARADAASEAGDLEEIRVMTDRTIRFVAEMMSEETNNE